MSSLTPKTQIFLTALFGGLIGAAYGFGIYLFPTIAPAMMDEFGFTYAQMGITTGLVQAGFLLFALTSGILTATFGPFAVIFGSLFLCTTSLGGLMAAPNFMVVSGCLVILGGCAASIWVPMVEVAQHFIHSKYQGRALGFMSSGTSYGVFANSILIALLLKNSNWRDVVGATFVITFCLFVCTTVFFHYLRKRRAAREKSMPEKTAPDSSLIEKFASTANKDTAVVLLLMFCAGVACMPFQAYLTSFLVDEHAFDVHESAVAWRMIGLTGMVSGFVMGWLADMITTRRALTCVCVMLSLSVFLLLGGEMSNWKVYSAAVLFGLSFYAIYGIIPAYISHVYKSGRAALVFALGSVVLGVGGMLGNVAGGFVKEYTHTFFGIYAIILLAAIFAALLTFFMRADSGTLDFFDSNPHQ